MSISYELSDDIALIRIDDGNKNVINHDVLDELEAAWTEAEENAKAIVLCGRPGSFCAGYDISVMTGGDADASAKLGRRGGRLGYRIFGTDKPTIGVATGHAFTIGAVWLACCDLRIGERGRFKYGMTEVALGVPLSGWPVEPLKARLNPMHYVRATLQSNVYDPDGALEVGFIDELVDADAGLAAAMESAARLVTLPAEAYAITKRRMRRDALAVMAEDLGLDSPQ